MTVCLECAAVEQGTVENEDADGVFEVCASCGMPAEECIRSFDEDYGKDR